jgi:hypothetical protein
MCWERCIQNGAFGNGVIGVWVLAGLRSSILYMAILRFSNVGTRLLFAKLKPAVASYFDIEIEILVLYFNMTALWTAHPDCPEVVKIELETRVRSFPPSFLLAPVDGEVFDNEDVSGAPPRVGSVAGFRRRLDKWQLETEAPTVRISLYTSWS